VTDVRTVAELERSLQGSEPELLQPATLSEIRSRGTRRRRTRLALTAGGTAAVVALAALVGTGVAGGDAGRGRQHVADRPQQPKQLSELARRALAEVPGARQVSSWQVVIPAGAARPADAFPLDEVSPEPLTVAPVDIGTRWYTGVTSFRKQDFPAWLWQGTQDYERHVLGDDEGYPVGSTDDGVIVDGGPLRLACVTAKSAGDPCYPAMLSGPDGDLSYEWGMGTDDFLQPGEGLELFHTASYTSGAPTTVWIGGTDGTDVASVDLVTTDGTTVSAHVESGTFVPGDTMFWGTVDGELALAVTRDADGKVLERHQVKPCRTPVACEVR
jgi:hypothetical protein